jgi:hypothetical protein
MRVRKGCFGSEGGESSQGTRGFLSHLVSARCQSSRHSCIPSKLVPWEGPARVRSRRIGSEAGGRSPRNSRISLKAVPLGDRRESGRGASNADLDDVCRGILASLKARASGGTGASLTASSSAAKHADDRHGNARC